jgi:hypothetical protein
MNQLPQQLKKKKIVIIDTSGSSAHTSGSSAHTSGSSAHTSGSSAQNNEIIQNLLEKYTSLNEKYQEMEKKMKMIEDKLAVNTISIPNNRTNIKKRYSLLDRLNNSSQEVGMVAGKKMTNHDEEFSTMVSQINQNHLKTVFKNKYEDGYALILLDLLNLYEKKYDFKIVRAFNEQVNTLYIYNNTSWTIWNATELMVLINKIYKCIINEFTKWQNANLIKFKEDEELANEYSLQLIKIIGNPASKPNFTNIIMKKLYKQIITNNI